MGLARLTRTSGFRPAGFGRGRDSEPHGVAKFQESDLGRVRRFALDAVDRDAEKHAKLFAIERLRPAVCVSPLERLIRIFLKGTIPTIEIAARVETPIRLPSTCHGARRPIVANARRGRHQQAGALSKDPDRGAASTKSSRFSVCLCVPKTLSVLMT